MNSSGSRAAALDDAPATGPAIRRELRPIAEALVVHSDTRYTFAGREVDLAAPGRMATPPLQPHPDPLVESLLSLLYQHAYCHEFRGTLAEPGPVEEDDGSLAQALTSANAGVDRVDRGWQIEATLPSGRVVARKGAISHTFFPGEFVVPDLRGQAASAGAPLQAMLSPGSWAAQPGFYMAFGDAVADDLDERRLVRFYWNAGAEAAPAVLGEITSVFNRFEIPFRLKCPSHPAAYTRRDALVLYLGRRYAHVGIELAARVWSAIRDRLREGAPLFTRPLARGLAFAEDPGGGESFGTQRIRLLAEAFCAERAGAGASDEARLAGIEGHLTRHGVSLEEPWRCLPDRADYDFTPFDGRSREEA